MPPAMRQIAKIRMYQSASVSRMRAHIVASPRGSKDRVSARRHLSEREAKFDRNVGRFSRFELLSSGARVTRAKKQVDVRPQSRIRAAKRDDLAPPHAGHGTRFQCPLRVRLEHSAMAARCPPCPDKRTSTDATSMSAWCQ